MFDYIILLLCVYVAYSNIRSLIAEPFANWGLVHWLLVLVTVGISLLAVARARMIIKREIKQRREAGQATQEGAADEAADQALDEAAGVDAEAPLVVTMEDLAHLDEVDLGDEDEASGEG